MYPCKRHQQAEGLLSMREASWHVVPAALGSVVGIALFLRRRKRSKHAQKTTKCSIQVRQCVAADKLEVMEISEG